MTIPWQAVPILIFLVLIVLTTLFNFLELKDIENLFIAFAMVCMYGTVGFYILIGLYYLIAYVKIV